MDCFIPEMEDEKSDVPLCNRPSVKELKKLECTLEIIYEKVQLANIATIDAQYRVLSGYVTCFLFYTGKDLSKSQVTQMRGVRNALKVIPHVILFS